MPDNQPRSRTRVSLRPINGSFLLGKFQARDTLNGPWYNSIPDTFYNASAFPSIYTGESTFDETHPGPPFLSGGPFKNIRVVVCEPPVGVYGSGVHMHQSGLGRYNGGFLSPSDAQFGSPSLNSLSTNLGIGSTHFPSMSGLGAQAYARTKPKLEKAGAGVFLAELRDLPRQLKTTSQFFHDSWKAVLGDTSSQIMQPKKVADNFLNHQFGWVPFVSDIGKFYNAFNREAEHISRISRQNGQWIRRRRTLQEETTSSIISEGFGTQLFPNTTFDGANWFGRGPWLPAGVLPSWCLSEVTYSRIYAVGRYRYYRPEFDLADPKYLSQMNSLSRQATLYGLRINPSNIYKATPWTWAIDWVSNVGDQIDYANDILVDSIATQYLYVMNTRVITRKFVQTFPFVSGPVSLSFERIISTKQRIEGSGPYGFDLTLANLTPRQLAIAGALGVSRGFS